MASAASPPDYDANGESYDDGERESGEADSLDAYTPTYTEAFPPLPVSVVPQEQKLSQSTWAAQTQAIRSSTITQVREGVEGRM